MCDFETMMLQGLVYHYSKELAEAWQAGDEAAVERVKAYIEGVYGRPALVHIAELATTLIMNGGV